MNAGSQAARVEGATLTERARAILRDEVANGALADIAAATRLWSANQGVPTSPMLTRRWEAEMLGLRDAVLDLIAPSMRSSARSSLPRQGTRFDGAEGRSQPKTEPLPVLRAVGSVDPGGAAEIHSALRNDSPDPVQIGFGWSDLVAEADDRIPASCLWLLPRRVHVPAGGLVDLKIGLDVPHDARPGLYCTLLEAAAPLGLRALLTFPVGVEHRESGIGHNLTQRAARA